MSRINCKSLCVTMLNAPVSQIPLTVTSCVCTSMGWLWQQESRLQTIIRLVHSLVWTCLLLGKGKSIFEILRIFIFKVAYVEVFNSDTQNSLLITIKLEQIDHTVEKCIGGPRGRVGKIAEFQHF